MALTVAEIVAKIRAEGADQVVSEMGKASAATKGWAKTVGDTGKSMTSAGRKAVLGVTTPIAGLAALIVNSASDVNEAESAVSTTYGKGSKIIIDASMSAAEAAGMSRIEYLQSATTLGVYAQSAGLGGNAAAKFGTDLLGAAGDMASFYNVPVGDALAAIQSGLTGEVEPLRKYGILLSDAAIQQYAMSKGIWDGSGAMTDQQKVLARQGYIMDNLGAAQGDFARTQGGLANQMRILKAETSNLAAEWGQNLLPLALSLVHGLRSITEAMSGLSPTVQKVVIIFAALAAAVGPLLIVFGTLLSSIGAIGAAFAEGGMLAGVALGPIALVIAALVGLGIAYKTNFLGFADAVNAVGRKIGEGFSWISEQVHKFLVLFDMFRQMTNPVSAAMKAISLVLSGLDFGPFEGLKNVLMSALGSGAAAMAKFVARMTKGFSQITAGLARIKKAFAKGGFGAAIDELFGKAGKSMLRGVATLVTAPMKAVGDFLRSFKTGFKPLDAVINSVGKSMQDIGNLMKDVIIGNWGAAAHEAGKLFGHMKDTVLAEAGLLIDGFRAIPWGKLWDGLKSAFSGLANVIKGIPYGDIASGLLASLSGAFNAIPWASLWDGLKSAASSLLSQVPGWVGTGLGMLADVGTNLLQSVVDGWDAIKPTLSSYASGLVGWVVGLIKDAPGALLSVGSDLLGAVRDGWDLIKPTLQAYASGLVGWVKGLITGAPDALRDIGSALLQSVIDGWDSLKEKLSSYASGLIDWVKGLVTGGGSADSALKPVGSGLLQSVLDGWDSLKSKLSGYASGLIGWVTGLVDISGAATALKNCGAAILQGLLDGWDTLKDKLTSYATGLVAFVSNLITGCDTALLDKGTELLQGLLNGWDSLKGKLESYASGLVDYIVGLVPSGLDALLDVGANLLGSVLAGWDSIKPRLEQYAGGLVDFVIGLVPDVGDGLKAVGSAFLTTLLSGWDSIKPTLESYAGGLVDYVVGLVPDVGKALFDKGAAILQTLLDGWNSVKDALGGAIGDVTSAIGGIATKAQEAIDKIHDLLGLLPGVGGSDKKDAAPTMDVSGATQAAADLATAASGITASVVTIGSQLATMRSDFDNAKTTVMLATAQMITDIGLFHTTTATEATNAGNDFNQNLYVGLRAGQDSAANTYAAMLTDLDGFVTDVGSDATDAGSDFNTNLYNGMYAGQVTASRVVTAIDTNLGTFVSSVRTFATTAGNNFNTNIYPGMYAGQTTVQSVLNAIASDLGFAVGNSGALAFAIGDAIGAGIQNGISSWVGAIAATAASAVSLAIAAAKNAAQAKSPSKRAINEVGGPIGEGIYVGIAQWLGRIASIGADASEAAIVPNDTNAIPSSLSRLYSASSPFEPIGRGGRNGASGGGGNTFIIMTKSELKALFDTVETVRVLTTPEEITAAMG